MKTIKLILSAILLMVAYVANAQTIQLYKDGAVVKEYSSAKVDSVVYKPAAAEPRYYYYAGWDCPSSVEELESFATNADNITTAGDVIDNYVATNYTKTNPLVDFNTTVIIAEDIDNADKWVLVIPKELHIFNLFGDVTLSAFTKKGQLGEHIIYERNEGKNPVIDSFIVHYPI